MSQQELIKKAENRIYIEPDQQIMPGITHVGRLDFSSAQKPLAPHSHGNAFEFCYLERGVAVFQCGRQKWTLKGGDCITNYPYEVHGTGSHPFERMKLYWIGYRPEILIPWITEGCPDIEQARLETSISSSLPRTFTGSRLIKDSINNAINAYTGNNRFRSVVIKSSLLNLFLHLAEEKNKPDIISEQMRFVIEFINKNLDKEILLDSCATLAGVSLSRFKNRFKDETGIPPGEFILRKRISKAEELLQSGYSVIDTSIECGFSSSQYFATVFKRYMNCSPSEWVKSE